MNYIDYFKSQAKKFYKDFQTQRIEGEDIDYSYYSYKPKFWSDLEDIINSFDIDEVHFSLMKAQHIIANLANFNSWNELLHANEYQLELGYYLIEYRDDNILDEWQWYQHYAQITDVDDEGKLDIFKHVFLKNASKHTQIKVVLKNSLK